MPKTPSINIRLLKMIKRFPELYNSQHDLANDKAHSMVVWDTISYELDTPVSVLKKKWQKLRSSHRKRCRTLKSGKSSRPLPQDDVFHLMYSMLDAPGRDSPVDGDGDDSSTCSAPTLSIISEEGGSVRSNSTSTIVPGVGANPRQENSTSDLPPRKTTPRRILRSQNRATRSGPPAAETAKAKDVREDLDRKNDSTPEDNSSVSSPGLENRKKSFARSKRQNEPVRAFFQSMALTVAKFPQHVQAVTKTKICNIVGEAELQLAPPTTR